MDLKEIAIGAPEEKKLILELGKRRDAEGLRLTRFLAMPDLSRTAGSPIRELVERIVRLPDFRDFTIARVPEIVPARESFDLFNFPPDHPARSRSDTYYVTGEYILRTHTTIMWYYYLRLTEAKEKIAAGIPIGLLSYGKVYRRDEIDREHMNVFHQMDGLYLAKREEKEIGLNELKEVLISIAKTIYGEGIKYRFNKDIFPYTDPSIEMEVNLGGPDDKRIEDPRFADHASHEANRDRWVEVLGSGMVRSVVLDNLGIDSKTWNGWAFGFGLERLAILSMNLPDIRLLWSTDSRVKRQLRLGNAYKVVSRYPAVTRDISFVVGADFVPNDYFDLIRDIGGELVEEVSLLDKYENPEKFGKQKLSYTYRIIYRSNERTLALGEINPIQEKITKILEDKFKAQIR